MPVPLRRLRRPAEDPPPATQPPTFTPDTRPPGTPGTPSDPPSAGAAAGAVPPPTPHRPVGTPPNPEDHIRSRASSGGGSLSNVGPGRAAAGGGPGSTGPPDLTHGVNGSGPALTGDAAMLAAHGLNPAILQGIPLEARAALASDVMHGNTGDYGPGSRNAMGQEIPPGLREEAATFGSDMSLGDLAASAQRHAAQQNAANQSAARSPQGETGAGGAPPGKEPVGAGGVAGGAPAAPPTVDARGRPLAGAPDPVTGLGAAETAQIAAQRQGQTNTAFGEGRPGQGNTVAQGAQGAQGAQRGAQGAEQGGQRAGGPPGSTAGLTGAQTARAAAAGGTPPATPGAPGTTAPGLGSGAPGTTPGAPGTTGAGTTGAGRSGDVAMVAGRSVTDTNAPSGGRGAGGLDQVLGGNTLASNDPNHVYSQGDAARAGAPGSAGGTAGGTGTPAGGAAGGGAGGGATKTSPPPAAVPTQTSVPPRPTPTPPHGAAGGPEAGRRPEMHATAGLPPGTMALPAHSQPVTPPPGSITVGGAGPRLGGSSTPERGSSYAAQGNPLPVWDGGGATAARRQVADQARPTTNRPRGPEPPLPAGQGSGEANELNEHGETGEETLQRMDEEALSGRDNNLADNAVEDINARHEAAEHARVAEREAFEQESLNSARDRARANMPARRSPDPDRMEATERPPVRHPDPETTAQNLRIAADRQYTQLREAVTAALEPLSAVVDSVGKQLDEVRRAIHRLVRGTHWTRYVLPCIVVSVQPENRQCSVRLMTGGQLVTKVKYGARTPAVGKEYAARWVNTLPLDPHSGSILEDVSIKVPPARALYRKDANTMTDLIRYEWPPPATPDGWTIDTIHEHLRPKSFLFGAATAPAPGGQEVVLAEFRETPAPFRDDGAIYENPATLAVKYTHFEGTGAGDQTQEYFTSPYYVRLDAIAYEGYNSVAHHIRFLPIDTGESHYYMPGTPTVRDHFECCLPNPFGGEVFCAGITNYDLHWNRHTFPASQADISAWAVTDHGRLGVVSDAQAHPWGTAYVLDTDGTEEPQHGTYQLPSGSCHWIFIGPAPIIVAFDSVTTTHFDVPPPGPDENFYIKQHQPQFDILAANAWYRDEQPREAWVVLQYTFPPFPPPLPTIVDRFFLQTTNLPAAELPVLYPHQGWGDGFITLNPENKVVVWGTDEQGDYYRWTAANPTWRRVVTLGTRGLTGYDVYSPDGQDIIGWTDGTRPNALRAGTAVQVYTTDGGDTWQPLPALPSGGRIGGNLAFIDAG